MNPEAPTWVAGNGINTGTSCADGGAEAFQRTSPFRRIIDSLMTLLKSVKVQRRKRQMSLCETLPLGEKRFLAIVEVDHQRLLIAATGHSVSLLQRLDTRNSEPEPKPETADAMFAGGLH